jgi:peptidoglycan/xylan/chitin deacetylase (PgdA/CDA1 family)
MPQKQGFLSSLISPRPLIKLTSQNIFLPFYHTISDKRLAHISNIYPVRGTKLFEDDLDYLCKHFKPISMNELHDAVYQDKSFSKPVFHLTFDDGLSEIYTLVAPILEKKGIPATFFINTGFIDNRDLFYRYKVSLIIEKTGKDVNWANQTVRILLNGNKNKTDVVKALLGLNINDLPKIDNIAETLEIDFNNFLAKEKPYLSYGQVAHLINRGFTIGSHSASHPFFKHIEPDDRKKQITESFAYLKNQFKIKDIYFSFPFSDEKMDMGFFKWMLEEQHCKLSFGISGLKRDTCKHHLHRIPFDTSLKPARKIVWNEYVYYIAKAFINKNMYQRK